MSKFKSYTGEEFFSLKLEPRPFLIESVVREGDSFIIVGDEKAGKSLVTFQMICSLTSGHPFLDSFTVNRTVRVSYVQIEGELNDSLDRFNRMIPVLDFDKSKFQIIFSPPINLQDSSCRTNLLSQVVDHQPDVLIIDPIYFAMSGSLSDDLAVRSFIGNLRILKDELNCALGLIHHTHKIRLDKQGNVLSEGDEAIFGSKFFKAWADHTLLFAYDKKRDLRILSCNTQRSGDILESIHLRLNNPNPLYFETMDKPISKSQQIVNVLAGCASSGMTPDELMTTLDIGRNSLYTSIKEPLINGTIVKIHGRPVRYVLKELLDSTFGG